jgi:hypothetical protein
MGLRNRMDDVKHINLPCRGHLLTLVKRVR